MSSSSAAKTTAAAVNTLSASRTRVIPKTIDFGSLTLNLERASARASKSPDATLKKQFEGGRTSTLLDRLASSRPSRNSEGGGDGVARPLQLHGSRRAAAAAAAAQGKSTAGDGSMNLDESSRSKINASRARFNRIPDPMNVSAGGGGGGASSSSRRPAAAASEYVREVSSLDKLAAESGIDGSVAGIRARRSYKDRIQARPAAAAQAESSTRFALPRRAPGSSSGRSRSPQMKSAGQSRERRQTKAQEEESARLAAIQARNSAAREQPVAYAYPGLSTSQFSPILSKVYTNGSKSSYRAFKNLEEDARDAVRLVVGNRSIVQKQTVLKKIGTWIPEEQSNTNQLHA